jgi:Mrp family chromosome partitioning ATPase/capsular polysaccharide biosynthesis protein
MVSSCWRAALAGVLIGALSGICVVLLAPRTYTAQVEIFAAARPNSADATSVLAGNELAMNRLPTYAALLTSRRTAEEVASVLPAISADDVSEKLSASVVPETLFLTATVTDISPDRAALIANAAAERLVAHISELERPPGGNIAPVSPRVYRLATPPVQPDVFPALVTLAVGIAAGGGVFLGIAMLRRIAGASSRSSSWPGRIGDVPILGALPSRRHAARNLSTLASEQPSDAARSVRSGLQSALAPRTSSVIMVAGTSTGYRTSATSATIAQALAEIGSRVLLIEADLDWREEATPANGSTTVGLSDLLVGRQNLSAAIRAIHPSFHVITAGSAVGAGELVAGPQMLNLVREARTEYDILLIDSGPVQKSSSLALATHVDIVLLVVRRGWSAARQLSRARSSLEAIHPRLFGVFLSTEHRKFRGLRFALGRNRGRRDNSQLTASTYASTTNAKVDDVTGVESVSAAPRVRSRG